MTRHSKPNQPLVTHLFTADPSAHVFNGELFIYPSHDVDHDGSSNDNGDQYAMEDYHVLSMRDLGAPCVDHGQALHLRDVPWASQQLWAPDAAFKNGRYYLYFPARDKCGIFRIGVATSVTPTGPFVAQPSYIPGSFSIDPAVFQDDDGRYYLYFGGLWGGQLEKWEAGSFNREGEGPSPTSPALGPRIAELRDDMLDFKGGVKGISILDESGHPILAQDEDRRYFEAR